MFALITVHSVLEDTLELLTTKSINQSKVSDSSFSLISFGVVNILYLSMWVVD